MVEFIETRVNLCSTTLFLKGKKKVVENTEAFSSRAFGRLFAQRELVVNSLHSTRVLSSLAPFTLLTLVVAHARKLIVMNFVEYTFLLCLRHVLTTRSPLPFADKSTIKRRSPRTVLREILMSD